MSRCVGAVVVSALVLLSACGGCGEVEPVDNPPPGENTRVIVPPEQAAAEYNEALEDVVNLNEEAGEGIHVYPGIDTVGLSDELFAQASLDSDPTSPEPWAVSFTGEAAEQFLESGAEEGDVIVGEGCMNCPPGEAVVLVVESVEEGTDANGDKTVTVRVRSAAVEDFIFGEWEESFPLESAGNLDQQGDDLPEETRAQALLDWAATGDLAALAEASEEVTIEGSVTAALRGNTVFRGRISATALPQMPTTPKENCTYTELTYNGEGARREWFADETSTIFLERCTEEIGVALDTTIEAYFSMLIDSPSPISISNQGGVLAYMPEPGFFWRTQIGDSPLSLDIRARVLGNLSVQSQVGGVAHLEGSYTAHLPVGFLAADGELQAPGEATDRFTGGTLDDFVDIDNIVGRIEVGLEVEADVVIKRAVWGRLGSTIVGTRARTDLGYNANARKCVSTGAPAIWFSRDSGQESYARGGLLPRKVFGPGSYGETTIGHFVRPTCPMSPVGSNLDFDPAACEMPEVPSVANPSIAPYLSQACAASASASCPNEDPTAECAGSIQHYFKPFFDPSGMCTFSESEEGYVLEWESGDRAVYGATQINIQEMYQSQLLELFSGNQAYQGEVVAEGDLRLEFVSDPTKDCVQETTYQLTAPRSETDEQGLYPSGFRPGDQLTTCLAPNGDITITCPNNEEIYIPQAVAQYGNCLLGGPCSPATEGSENASPANQALPYPRRSAYQLKGLQPDFWQGTPQDGVIGTPAEGMDTLVAAGTSNVSLNLVWAQWEPTLVTDRAECESSTSEFGERVYYDGHCFTVRQEIADAIEGWSERGVNITAIVYGTPDWAQLDNCKDGGTLPTNWDIFCAPKDHRDYGRFAGFLAHYYSGATAEGEESRGRIADFVIHNEVNQSYWFNIGCVENCSVEDHMRFYAFSYAAAYDRITQVQPEARVYVSLDHAFGDELQTMGRAKEATSCAPVCQPGEENCPAPGVTRCYETMAGENFLRRFDEMVSPRQWRVAFHPYSPAVGGPIYDANDWPYISMGNIGALSGWLYQNFPTKYYTRQIQLTESGYNGFINNPAHPNSIQEQRDAVCNSLANVLATPGINTYIYHRMVDVGFAEGGLELGLASVPATRNPDGTYTQHFDQFQYKDAFHVWANSNLISVYPPKLDCGFERLPYTYLGRSFNPVTGKHWSSSRLPPAGFQQEQSWRLFREQRRGTQPIFECFVNDHTFLSRQPDCEGTRAMGPVGFTYRFPSTGLVNLYRCRQSAEDHLIRARANAQEERTCPAGYVLDDVDLGWVFPAEAGYQEPSYPLDPNARFEGY